MYSLEPLWARLFARCGMVTDMSHRSSPLIDQRRFVPCILSSLCIIYVACRALLLRLSALPHVRGLRLCEATIEVTSKCSHQNVANIRQGRGARSRRCRGGHAAVDAAGLASALMLMRVLLPMCNKKRRCLKVRGSAVTCSMHSAPPRESPATRCCSPQARPLEDRTRRASVGQQGAMLSMLSGLKGAMSRRWAVGDGRWEVKNGWCEEQWEAAIGKWCGGAV
mmetsp:Transcript_64290/g.127035  ORF Transcript_64290/g.127035 Transcript_64290/m.127035 type:complete len:223 (-) Transcript_64290:1568-2236(-)